MKVILEGGAEDNRMPGPFIGMDPYLEHPALFPGLHLKLIAGIESALNASLPTRYVASSGERLYVVQPDRAIYPDVAVVERENAVAPAPRGAMRADAPLVVMVDAEEIREFFIEIFAVGDQTRVVTAMEVLSPGNKAPGTAGRDLYLKKQAELLKSRSHFIEIDLLRTGAHTIAAPLEALGERQPFDYAVCLHRAGQTGRFEVWPRTMRQPLPAISVPLDEGDADVILDLQHVFDLAYEAGAYSRRIDYRREPHTPLAAKDRQWAAESVTRWRDERRRG